MPVSERLDNQAVHSGADIAPTASRLPSAHRLKNVVVIADSASPLGGSSQVALKTAAILQNSGVHVTYFAGQGPIDSCLNGIETTVVNKGTYLESSTRVRSALKGIWDKKTYNELLAILKSHSPLDTVVHVHGWNHCLSASVFSAIAKMGYKVAITPHDYFLICPNGGLYNYKARKICSLQPSSFKCYACNCDKRSGLQKAYRVIRHLVQQSCIRKCDIEYACLSEFTYTLLTNSRGPISKKVIIPSPIERQRVSIGSKSPEGYLFVGRLSPEKNPELFCKAVTELGLKGTMVGDGPLADDLKQRYPTIVFTGRLSSDEIDRFYAESKALVLTSDLYEASPLVCAEALLAASTPSIVPSICGATSYIKDGVNGLLFESKNLESLKQALCKMEDAEQFAKLKESTLTTVDELRKSRSNEAFRLRLSALYENMLGLKPEEQANV